MKLCGCFLGVVVNNVERLERDELLWQCPAGSYPCNATIAGARCVERHRWCDHVVDCPNEEDEDPQHCCQYKERNFDMILPCQFRCHCQLRVIQRLLRGV